MTVIDETQLKLSEIRITQNSELQYSPVLSSDRPIAAKAMTPIAVAPNSGHWFWATTSRTTSQLVLARLDADLDPFDDDDRVVGEHAEGDDQRAERDPLHQQIALQVHHQERRHDRQEQHHADDQARLAAHREQQHDEDDRHRLAQVEHEVARRRADRFGLEIDLADLDADRLIGLELVELAGGPPSPIVTTLPPCTVEMPRPIAGWPS